MNLFKKIFRPALINSLLFFAFFACAWSFGTFFSPNETEVLSTCVEKIKYDAGDSFSFIDMQADDSFLDNGADVIDWSVEVYMGTKYTYMSHPSESYLARSLFYLTEKKEDYAPITVNNVSGSSVAFSAISSSGTSYDSVDYDSLALTVIEKTSEDDKLNSIYLSFSLAKEIMNLFSLRNLEDLYNKELPSICTTILSKEKTNFSWIISGVFSEESSSLFEKRIGPFAAISKNNRKKTIGCQTVEVCENVGGQISYCSLLRSLKSFSNQNKSTFSFYVLDGSTYSKIKMETIKKNYEKFANSGMRQGICIFFGISMLLYLFCFLILFKKKIINLNNKSWFFLGFITLFLFSLILLAIKTYSAFGLYFLALSETNGAILYSISLLLFAIGLVADKILGN